jgi:hypothetical protein
MEKLLTMDEIESCFPSEWVLLEDIELTPELEIVRGKVVWHSKDRDEIHTKALEMRPRRPALLYAGAPPEDMEYVL